MKSKIAYVTDIHLDEAFPKEQGVDTRKNWLAILGDISSKGIEEIIYGGDIGETSSNEWFFESLSKYTIDLTLGNHDEFKEVAKHFNHVSPSHGNELYYAKYARNYKFIFLDSSAEIISQEQFAWFENELVTTESILLFIHHPILKVNLEVDNLYPLKGRERLRDALLAIPNQVTIFCGHYHLEDELTHQNIRQFITPAGSFQVEKHPSELRIHNRTFGYREIEIREGKVDSSLVMFCH